MTLLHLFADIAVHDHTLTDGTMQQMSCPVNTQELTVKMQSG